MRILAVGKALTEHRTLQRDITARVADTLGMEGSARHRLEALHGATQVTSRHLAMPPEAYTAGIDFTSANRAFIEVGTQLAEAALSRALAEAELDASELDAIFFTTVTGVAVPAIDAKLINRLGLRRDVKRIPLFGLGCLAGAAGISRMHDYLVAFPTHRAALVAVELCSLTFQHEDRTVANMVASGLFGDGAAAVIASGKRCATPVKRGLDVHATRSAFYYESEDVMGWDIGSHGFRVQLSAAVPEFVEKYVAPDLREFLADQGLAQADVATWICHPGGPKVLDALEQSLGLERRALEVTWRSLAAVGNLSSVSVLFVLADTLATNVATSGSQALMMAMGPGFSAEFVRLVWR